MTSQATADRAPGVYLEQVATRPSRTLETGVPAFVGICIASPEPSTTALASAFGLSALLDSKPVAVPLDLTTWAALDAECGTAWAGGVLGFAVRGFFENGGRRCCVVTHECGELAEALAVLDGFDDFDIVCAPDIAGTSSAQALADQSLVLDLCSRRPGCFALLDGPGTRSLDASDLEKQIDHGVAKLRTLDQALRFNAALYAPWIKVAGACKDCKGKGCSTCNQTGQGYVPPSGHIAGVLARLDERIGVHRAPANEPIEGVLDLQCSFDDATLADLNAKGVNCIRALPGRGIRPWGARTLVPDHPAFSHVNMRRTYLTVARWLELLAADLTFEPNDLRLWLAINRRITAFLEDLHHKGALYGASPAEAFYVKCDAETTPPEVRDKGQIVTEVGLSLAHPNELVVLRLHAGSGTSSVTGFPG